MQTVLLQFDPATGWSQPLPDLDSPQTLVLVFGSYDWHRTPGPFLDLQETYPRSVIAGCSGHGAIHAAQLLQDALVVSITRFTHTRLRLASQSLKLESEGDGTSSWNAGFHLAKDLQAPDLQGILVFTDGLHTNGSELVKGLNAHLANSVVVAGGLSADDLQFAATWLLENSMPVSQRVCGIGFYGNAIRLHSHARDGWKPFGPERLITRSEGNILYELDGCPALELYKRYLGDHANALPASGLSFPLSVCKPDDGEGTPGMAVVRTILGIDEEQQSMRFAGDIPQTYKARLIYGSLDNLIEGAEEVAQQLAEKLPDSPGPVLAIAISCAARRLVMKEDTELELEATLDNLPPTAVQTGFYSLGELCPTLETGTCDLHNQTMTLTVIYERT